MDSQVPPDAIVLTPQSVESEDPQEIIWSNVEFVNLLKEQWLEDGEISRDALRSYYVDHYRCQIDNGGISQFIYNSRWDRHVVQCIAEGLAAIHAPGHLKLFQSVVRQVDKLGQERREAFLDGDYFGGNALRDELNKYNDHFRALSKREDLLALNARWLGTHPALVVMREEQMQAMAMQRGRTLPDLQERIARARQAEPRHVRIMRVLCGKAGLGFERATASQPMHVYQGKARCAHFFLTDQGVHHMLDLGRKAVLFRGHGDGCKVSEMRLDDEQARASTMLGRWGLRVNRLLGRGRA